MIKKSHPGRPSLKKLHKICKPAKYSQEYGERNEYKQSLSELEQTEDEVSCGRSSDFQQLRSIQQLANELYLQSSKNILSYTHGLQKSDGQDLRNIDELAEELFNEEEILKLYRVNKQQPALQQSLIHMKPAVIKKRKQLINKISGNDDMISVDKLTSKSEKEILPQIKNKLKKKVTFCQKTTKDLKFSHQLMQPKIIAASQVEKLKDNKQSTLNSNIQKLTGGNQQKIKDGNRKDSQASQQQISKIRKWKNEAAEARKAFSMVTPAYQKLIIEQNQLMMPPQCTVIRWDSLMEMYNVSQDCFPTLFYHMQEGENPFFSKVFVILRTQLDYAKIYKMRENNLAKMRTFIVRRVLDDFVAQTFQDSPEQLQHLAKHNRRITRFDRNRYQQIGIPEPPSRMKSQYLSNIFSNPQFKQFFLDYIQSSRLQQYLQSSNKKMKTKYQQEITHIAYKKISVQQKIDLFRNIKRKPLFSSQILEYLDQGKMISVQYCNEKLDSINVQ